MLRTIMSITIGSGEDAFDNDHVLNNFVDGLHISGLNFDAVIDSINAHSVTKNINLKGLSQHALPTLEISPFYDAVLNQAIFPAGQ